MKSILFASILATLMTACGSMQAHSPEASTRNPANDPTSTQLSVGDTNGAAYFSVINMMSHVMDNPDMKSFFTYGRATDIDVQSVPSGDDSTTVYSFSGISGMNAIRGPVVTEVQKCSLQGIQGSQHGGCNSTFSVVNPSAAK